MSAKKVAESMVGVLADAYVLLVKTQNYHWNVEGPHFHSLHALFEAQYTELFAAVDEIAERVRALGFPAPGTMAEFLRLTGLSEGQRGDESAMLRDLLASHEAAAARIHKAIHVADDEDDEVSEDLLIGRLNVHQKAAWMLRATLAGMAEASPAPSQAVTKSASVAAPAPAASAAPAVKTAAPAVKTAKPEKAPKADKPAKPAMAPPVAKAKAAKVAKGPKIKKARG